MYLTLTLFYPSAPFSASGQASGALTVNTLCKALFAACDTSVHVNGTRVLDYSIAGLCRG